MKISWHIIVLIVRGCFDQMHGLNKLFFHLMRALCLRLIMMSHLVFFHVYYKHVQYCAEVMQTNIVVYRDNREISAISKRYFRWNDISAIYRGAIVLTTARYCRNIVEPLTNYRFPWAVYRLSSAVYRLISAINRFSWTIYRLNSAIYRLSSAIYHCRLTISRLN